MKPRHYALLVLLIGIAIFDYVRMNRAHKAPAATPVQITAAPASAVAAKAWAAYDDAASHRDASAADFTPKLNAFDAARAQITAQPGSYAAQDLETCRLWMMQYRNNGQMKPMAAHHIDSCTQLHRDVAQ